jgi:1-acyl-sn-glycerol-3-phosphate acyltransferase
MTLEEMNGRHSPTFERSLLWKSLGTVARIWTTLCFDLKTYHEDYVPRTGGVLLIANHQSYLDPVLVAVRLRRPVSFFAKSELFENPYFAWLIRSLHAFPVRQGKADISAVKETIRRLKEGYILNLYPEGTRTEDGRIGPIQKGVALIVRQAKVPVVPVAIDGSFEAWPQGKKLCRSYPIRVLYGPPLRIDALDAHEVLQLVDQTLRTMLQELRSRRQAEACS